jgi:pyridoxamine 5'-phosphate oxidase
MDITHLRKSYERDELIEAAAAADPLQQFQRWFEQAVNAKLPEPNAMTLATVGANGRPSTRVVLIKGFDARGLVWFSNYDSRKGLELAGCAWAALQFHWVELERVVRIEGAVQRIAPAESDAYYSSRPLDSRLGAWASPQSQVIGSREVLEAAATQAAQQHGTNPERPPFWGGYRLQPDAWEFWQGRASRLHDRLRYTVQVPTHDRPPEATAWLRERLAP